MAIAKIIDTPTTPGPRVLLGSGAVVEVFGDGITVVVADDNEIQLAYLARLVETFGFDVAVASNGLEALELVEARMADILVTDVQMPNLDGIELTKSVRSRKLERYVHIILVTASDEDETRDAGLQAGADDFITKGTGRNALKARMRSAARLARHQREIQEQRNRLTELYAQTALDLKAAAKTQLSLLPDRDQCFRGYSFEAKFKPSDALSGDMYGYYELDERHLGFYAIDVSGHGVRASLKSVTVAHLLTARFFRDLVLTEGSEPDPQALLSHLNERFCGSSDEEYFTMLCGVIDRSSGRLYYCQGGYSHPILRSARGEVEMLGEGGLPVGLIEGARFTNSTTVLEPYSTLVIYSDAVTEAESEPGRQFGEERLRQVVASCSAELPTEIAHEVWRWANKEKLDDDLTILSIRRDE